MSGDRSLLYKEYEVKERNQVSKKKAWKESDFKDGKTGFDERETGAGSCVVNIARW